MHTEPVSIAKPADAAPDDVPADIRARVQTLRAELLAHNRAYYEEDAPTVEDSVYDGLFLELQQLEARWPALLTPDSPTQRVGSAPSAGFGTVTHRVPMRSLSNAFSEADVLAFDRRLKSLLGVTEDFAFSATPKLDGLAATLRYEHGGWCRAPPGVMASLARTSRPICARYVACPRSCPARRPRCWKCGARC